MTCTHISYADHMYMYIYNNQAFLYKLVMLSQLEEKQMGCDGEHEKLSLSR